MLRKIDKFYFPGKWFKHFPSQPSIKWNKVSDIPRKSILLSTDTKIIRHHNNIFNHQRRQKQTNKIKPSFYLRTRGQQWRAQGVYTG